MAVAPNITSAAPGHIPQSIPCVNCHLKCSSNVNLLTGTDKSIYNIVFIYYSQYKMRDGYIFRTHVICTVTPESAKAKVNKVDNNINTNDFGSLTALA